MANGKWQGANLGALRAECKASQNGKWEMASGKLSAKCGMRSAKCRCQMPDTRGFAGNE